MNFDERLDPELRLMIDRFPAFNLDDISAVREGFKHVIAGMQNKYSDNISIEDVYISSDNNSLRIRLYRPRSVENLLPALLWIHGGGYILGTADMSDERQSEMALRCHCVIVSVDYRLAPEHPYPAALNNCYAALEWLFASATKLSIDASRIAVGGASAGGGLAAAVALLARDRNEVNPTFQLLIYPMLDDRNTTRSSHDITDRRVWNRETNLIGWRAYLGEKIGKEDVSAYAAPARADNLQGLPPAFIAVGTLDPFLDEDIEYARRLSQFGVLTELHVYPGAFHGFDAMAPNSVLSKRAMRDFDTALLRAFSNESDLLRCS
ncbi:MAG: alpha/beta hydrolase [Spongiibacteraceae bacterium]